MTDTPDEIDETEIVHQPTLPDLELPLYHGQKPVGMKTSLTGAGNRISKAHDLEERVILVIEAKCKSAGHDSTDDGILYVEKLKVSDLFEIEGDQGVRLIRHLRSTYNLKTDRANGVEPLTDPTGELVLHADASGVILTDREAAERRGEDIVGVLDDSTMTPAVVIYSNGERSLWPDEFDKGTARPAIGDPLDVDPAVKVTELLHHATGEPLFEVEKRETDEAIAYFGGTPAPDPGEKCACGAKDLMGAKGVEVGGVYHRADGPCFHGTADEIAAQISEWEGEPGDHRPAISDDVPSLSDGVPAFDDLTPPAAEIPPLPGEEMLEARLPTKADFDFVNTAVPKLKVALVDVDADRLPRLLEAEKQGRGHGFTPRRQALAAIHARAAELGVSL